jgi:hypothetical protein
VNHSLPRHMFGSGIRKDGLDLILFFRIELDPFLVWFGGQVRPIFLLVEVPDTNMWVPYVIL